MSPQWHRQETCIRIGALLDEWSFWTGAGRVSTAPGVISAEDDDVALDVVWISGARLAGALDEAEHPHAGPELVVEVRSPGARNERRDREAKRQLYARWGVAEYWIVEWPARSIAVYRRGVEGLALVETIGGEGMLTTPLLPGFAAPLARIFAGFPPAP